MRKFHITATDKDTGVKVYGVQMRGHVAFREGYVMKYGKDNRDSGMLTDPAQATLFTGEEAIERLLGVHLAIGDRGGWIVEPRIELALKESDPCEAGMHSWVDDPTIRSGNCTRCAEPYGDPS